MRKHLFTFLLSISVLRAFADEGLWLPFLLGTEVYNNMVKKGLKLTKDQLYHINKASLKDAIVLIGGNATASLISNKGLILASYSGNKDAIESAAAKANIMLGRGYYARTNNEELPTALHAEILLRVEDVTQAIHDSIGVLTGRDRQNKINTQFSIIAKRYSDPKTNTVARVTELFQGQQYLVFVYQRYHDIRLVGIPDAQIAEFGGLDNYSRWPKHAADFALFRIYTSATGKGGPYAAENVPITSKTVLSISLKGFKEGDFTIVPGYPSSTDRYAFSPGIELARNFTNPAKIALRSIQLKTMESSIGSDSLIASEIKRKYDQLIKELNYYTGESEQLSNTVNLEKIKSTEQLYNTWAKSNPEYQSSLADLQKGYDAWKPYSKHQVYITDGFFASSLVRFAATLQQVENVLVKRGNGREINTVVRAADKARSEMVLLMDKTMDQKLLANSLFMFYSEIDKSQHPIGYFEGIKGSFGDLKQLATYEKYIAAVFSTTMILDDTKWNSFIKNPDGNVLQADPGYAIANAFLKNWQSKYQPQLLLFSMRKKDAADRYRRGSMKMDSLTAQKMYPDADSTLRISYGSIQGFADRSGVKLKPISTISQMVDQHYQDKLPATIQTLVSKKDYGIYADKLSKTLVTNFITNNDFASGSGGSPVLDANGNLIGVVSTVNSEGFGFRYVYSPEKNRVICTDIRFILWCLDKVAGNTELIKEMKIVK